MLSGPMCPRRVFSVQHFTIDQSNDTPPATPLSLPTEPPLHIVRLAESPISKSRQCRLSDSDSDDEHAYTTISWNGEVSVEMPPTRPDTRTLRSLAHTPMNIAAAVNTILYHVV